MSNALAQPLISVVILNYNGAKWLERCLESLKAQTIFNRIEVILADNASRDGSDELAQRLMQNWPHGRFVQNGANLGYCEGNNRAARLAQGKYLFILNNDAWLEPDCLEKLATETERTAASAATPLVLNYSDDSVQSMGGTGLDLCGMPNTADVPPATREQFAVCGCSFLIEAELFRALGEFDAGLFMYGDETDLSWRVWIAGRRIVGVPSARLHHRGAVSVNPEGGAELVESRTSHTKRYYANRNSILFLLKNSQHALLLLLVPHLFLLLAEALASLALVRKWSFVREAYCKAIADCWRMRGHVREWRRRIKGFRRRSDFWMLRFLRLKPSRWAEVERLFKVGVPKVDSR